MSPLLLVVLLCLIASNIVCSGSIQGPQCDSNNKFRIVQFTDTHFGESNIGDYLTLSLMRNILDIEKPNLVVLSGDIVSGYTWNGKKGWFANLWRKIVEPMISRNIPWIFTPGNHDAEGELNRAEIMELDHYNYSKKGSFTQIGFIDELSLQNIYNIPIYDNNNNSNENENEIVQIWMIDSGQMDCNNNWDYMGCVQLSLLEYFIETTHYLHNIPVIIYMHIAPPQTATYYDSNKYPQIGRWTGQDLYCFDERNINLNNLSFNDYILNNNNNIIAMFNGHEHDIDSALLYENDLLIAFGRKTGEGWMIGTDNDFSIISGSRIFEFDCKNIKEKQWKTWIRDKYLNVIHNTSFNEMKLMKKDIDKIEECNKNIKERSCLRPCVWQQWKPIITEMFHHPIKQYFTDIMDIFCRFKITKIINDYIYDLGMTDNTGDKSCAKIPPTSKN